jgi:hypothetical protein
MANGDNATDLQDFADMSAALTGFQSTFLKPALDTTNLTGAYFDVATEKTKGSAATVQTLLAAYRAIRGEPAQQIADTLLETAQPTPSAQALLAQSIVKMWYTASWYEPGSAEMAMVVSSIAYTKGLAWQVMQSHPMGYSPFSFGYWSKPPGPLSQFGVNTVNGSDGGKGGGQ